MGMNELDKRERGTVFFAFLFLLLAIFMLIYVPNSWGDRYRQAKQRVEDQQQHLQLARLEKREEEVRVESQEQLLEILNARGDRFDLFPFINRVVGETGLSERARLENPSGRRRPANISDKHPLVDLELSGVTLEEIVELLYAIRGSDNLVAVYKMEIEPMPRDQGLHCEITFVSVKV